MAVKPNHFVDVIKGRETNVSSYVFEWVICPELSYSSHPIKIKLTFVLNVIFMVPLIGTAGGCTCLVPLRPGRCGGGGGGRARWRQFGLVGLFLSALMFSCYRRKCVVDRDPSVKNPVLFGTRHVGP